MLKSAKLYIQLNWKIFNKLGDIFRPPTSVLNLFWVFFVFQYCFCFRFSVCPEGNWGDNCTQTCSCVTANTRTCDGVTGTCDCLDGWTGGSCNVDIDECNKAAIHQCPDNSECQNTNGSFYCQCNTGYLKAGDATCQGIGFVFLIFLYFFFNFFMKTFVRMFLKCVFMIFNILLYSQINISLWTNFIFTDHLSIWLVNYRSFYSRLSNLLGADILQLLAHINLS